MSLHFSNQNGENQLSQGNVIKFIMYINVLFITNSKGEFTVRLHSFEFYQ